MTTRKKKTTRTKKVEAVVDYDGHDVVEEIKEPKVPHIHTMKIYQKSGIGKPDRFVGRAHFSEKREQMFANPPTDDDLVRIVSSGYMAKGIQYRAHTKEWIVNLPDAALPDLMYADLGSYIIGVEE